MTVSSICLFLPQDEIPLNGLHEGLEQAATAAARQAQLPLHIVTTEAQLKNLPPNCLFASGWSDTHAAALRQAHHTLDRNLRPGLLFDRAKARRPFETFGEEDGYLSYIVAFNTTEDKLFDGEEDETYTETFAPWQKPDIDKRDLLLVPSKAAAIYYGFESEVDWIDQQIREHRLNRPLYSFHPDVVKNRQVPPQLLSRHVPFEEAILQANVVYALQSTAAYIALRLGVPVVGHPTAHPVGWFVEETGQYGTRLNREKLFKRLAARDIPANKQAIFKVLLPYMF